MSGGYWGVSRKDKTGRGQHPRFGKRQLSSLDEPTNSFQTQKCRMTLVHVEDGGLQSDRFEGAITSDPQKDLLSNAHLQVAAVQLVRDPAALRTIFRNVR